MYKYNSLEVGQKKGGEGPPPFMSILNDLKKGVEMSWEITVRLSILFGVCSKVERQGSDEKRFLMGKKMLFSPLHQRFLESWSLPYLSAVQTSSNMQTLRLTAIYQLISTLPQ